MIHFDFVVEDVDAENIFNSISMEINNSQLASSGLLNNISLAEKQWHIERVVYLKNLIQQMKNTHIT